MPAGALSSAGSSAIVASVVMSRQATDAASWSAVRTTLVGSITPAGSLQLSATAPYVYDRG